MSLLDEQQVNNTAYAANDVYLDLTSPPPNHQVLYTFEHSSGFKATLYQDINTYDYMVSVTGTEQKDTQGNFDVGLLGLDAASDLTLAVNQWEAVKDDFLFALSKKMENKAANIVFTGHSLGGILAQYATYYFVKDIQGSLNNLFTGDIALTTFSSPGSSVGFDIMNDPDGFDQSLLNDVEIMHFGSVNRLMAMT